MIAKWLQRTTLLYGDEHMEQLQKETIAIVGLGGVGGAAAEALCRSGIGSLILMDYDNVDDTNRNRQIFATTKTVGMSKCNAAAQRLKQINPDCNLFLLPIRYDSSTYSLLFNQSPRLIIDAIDTVTSKLHLAKQCEATKTPSLMCLGTGNRFHPELFRMGKIQDTVGCGCPLARIMRKELKRRGIFNQRVLYSIEQPTHSLAMAEHGRHAPGSTAFCPPVAGYLLAAEAIRLLFNTIK